MTVGVFLCLTNKEGDSKGENLRLAQVRKPEFTMVNEDFRGKHNAKFTLLSHPPFCVIKKTTLS